MCEWNKTVLVKVPIFPEFSHTGMLRFEEKPIDSCIAPIIEALNQRCVYTTSCCCGHGKTDGSILLRDGREIIIKKDQSNEKLMGGDMLIRVLRNELDSLRSQLSTAKEAIRVKDKALRELRDECITAALDQSEGSGDYVVDGKFLDAAQAALSAVEGAPHQSISGEGEKV